MSQIQQLLTDSLSRLLEAELDDATLRRAEQGQFAVGPWRSIEALGLPAAMAAEIHNGFGLSPAEALSVIRLIGAHAAPLPLSGTMLANWLLSSAGLAARNGVLAIAPTGGHACIRAKAADGHLEISGEAAQIAWGRHAETTVALAHDDRGQAFVAAVPRQGWTICEMDDIAHRPSDRLIFDARVPTRDFARAPAWLDAVALRAAGAAAAVMTMAGAIGALLDMTTRYCGERVQFGRPLAKFQAVQQQLAILAEQSAAASGAADIATRAFGQGIDINQVAAAKARAGEAAGKAAAIAHQLHGAIGFTEEHRLHFYSRLLWALRDECGHEEEWRLRLGKSLLAEGAADLWPALAAL